MNDNILIAEIEGLAAVYGVRDLNGDIVERGAFERTLQHRTAPVRMLYQHAAEQPIGCWTSFRSNARGLHASGYMLLSSPRGREIYNLIAGGGLDGLSIGYRTAKARQAKGARHILEADLWEVSIVTFPMAPAARIARLGDPKPLHRHSGGASPRALPAARASVPPSTDARDFADAIRGAADILSA